VSEADNKPGFLSRLLGGRSEADEPADQARDRLMRAAENFHDLKVEDVMVPRAEVIAVPDNLDLADLAKTFIEAGHSRLPVYKDTLDEPTGFVHVKDVLAYLVAGGTSGGKAKMAQKIIRKIQRPVLFVPPSMGADALLGKMQASRVHMALVVDEYGGTDGLVTLEDLIEPIVGDIEDEHDEEEPQIQPRKDKTGRTYWDVDARVDIDDFEKAAGFDIATPELEEDVDTLGGLVFSLLGRVPGRGEIIPGPNGVEFEILDADPRRIKRLRLRHKD